VPPWCAKGGEHDLHTRQAGHAGDVWAALVQDDSWDRPRFHISHSRTFPGSAGVLPLLREADDMAAVMAALGHEDIAKLICRAGDGAR
jgi:hypothetical protein